MLREVTLAMIGGLGVAANGKEKCIITLQMHVFEHHMYILVIKDELYMYIQLHACIVGMYTAPVPMQVHCTALVQSQSTLWFCISSKTPGRTLNLL